MQTEEQKHGRLGNETTFEVLQAIKLGALEAGSMRGREHERQGAREAGSTRSREHERQESRLGTDKTNLEG